jgi:hypothetical protein
MEHDAMKRTLILLGLAMTLAVPAAAQRGAWVHLSIRHARSADAAVRINLPAAVVTRAAPLIPETDAEGYRLVVGEDSITAHDLSTILVALSGAPDGTAVRRDTGDVVVNARREGATVQLVVEDAFDGDTVAATIPLPVAEALAAGGRRLDIASAVRHLAATGGGELALIAADHSKIRIWVDGSARQITEW